MKLIKWLFIIIWLFLTFLIFVTFIPALLMAHLEVTDNWLELPLKLKDF